MKFVTITLYTKGGTWLYHVGKSNSLCAHLTRFITNLSVNTTYSSSQTKTLFALVTNLTLKLELTSLQVANCLTAAT